jgi:hypothetical protein
MQRPYGLHKDIARRYRDSIKLFDSEFVNQPEEIRTELIYIIIGACESARTFDWTPEQTSRDADRNAIKEAKSAAKHALKFAEYCRAYPWQMMSAILGAILRTGVHLRTKEDEQPIERGVAFSPSYSIRLADLLTQAAVELNAGNLSAKRGPFVHRTRHGPLNYNKPIENNADLPAPPTALAIYLSFLFRKQFLVGEAYFQPGETIPVNGKPRWKLVEKFVSDSLGVDGDFKDAATKVLGRNRTLEIVGYRWGRTDEKLR